MTHHPRKRFGQHFLQDEAIILQLIKAIAPQRTDTMVEIGPGLGALTTQILPFLNTLHAVELDWNLITPLTAACKQLGTLHIYSADALCFDFTQLTHVPHSLRVIGNLPYQISTPLLFHLITQMAVIKDMHFMLQKEVVDRLAAVIGTKAYGRLSVMAQYHFEIESLFTVPREAFHPMPQVTSAVVRLIPRTAKLLAHDYSAFSLLVQNAFNYRRKTLTNSLKGLITTEQLKEIGIDPGCRAEELSVWQFVEISNRAKITL